MRSFGFLALVFMEGVSRALFVPLTLGVGFSMIGSFVLSRTLVPILSTWLHEERYHEPDKVTFFKRVQLFYSRILNGLLKFKLGMIFIYLVLTGTIVFVCASTIGTEIFPHVDAGQFQVRLKAPTGTAIDSTEQMTLKVLDKIKDFVGKENVEATVAFVGTQPPNYAISTVYLWTGGPQEAVVEVQLKTNAKIPLENLKERLREDIKENMPEVEISFEPSDLVDRTMSQGSSTPIEVSVSGIDIQQDKAMADKIKAALAELPFIRDLQFAQRLDYPAYEVEVNRRELGKSGLTVGQLGNAIVPATSSSRYLVENFWRDPKNGINYQVQVQVPQKEINSVKDLEEVRCRCPTAIQIL